MMRLRGELTPDAVAEMMAQYVTTASAGSSAAHLVASNRSQNVSFILADGRTCERDGQRETFIRSAPTSFSNPTQN